MNFKLIIILFFLNNRMARRFTDAREIVGDPRSLMNLHNNKAGRKVS